MPDEKAPAESILLFDFDGVIADSLELFTEGFGQMLRDLGYPALSSREAILGLFEGNVIKGLVRAGFPLYRLRQLGREFGPRIAEALLEVRPFPGMPALLNDCARRYPTYVITSNLTAPTEGFLAAHGIQGICEVLGADKESSKVKKIRRVRRKHRGTTAYYFGDTKGDMIEAARAGAVPVAVAWGWHTEDKLREADPTHVVHTPQEIVDLLA